MIKILRNQPLDFRAGAIYDPKIEKKRMKIVLEFMGKIRFPILDVGDKNGFGKEISRRSGCTYPLNTSGDLDGEFGIAGCVSPFFNTVWIFEVIEHLMNPLSFLTKIKEYCRSETKIFVTYPQRKIPFFWTPNHFHEMDERRFKYLVESAGYEIVKHKKKILYRKWSSYFKGIRPFCRLFLVPDHHHYYELRVK
jgi:hypothetical protein